MVRECEHTYRSVDSALEGDACFSRRYICEKLACSDTYIVHAHFATPDRQMSWGEGVHVSREHHKPTLPKGMASPGADALRKATPAWR